MTLETERLVLRAPSIDDAERLAVIANDVRVARNLTEAFPFPYSLEDAVAFIESGPDGFAIESTQTIDGLEPGLIGMVGGTPGVGENADVHNFGYWLATAFWGHGLATEAGRAFLDHVIVTQRPRRIEAQVYGWNPASSKVLEKLGFELEGRFRSRVRRFGEVTDELMYALLPD